MAVTNTAVFPQTPRTAVALCTAAKTTYDDAANAVLLLTAGADGSELTYLGATPRGTITATQIQVYISRDDGATLDLLATEVMTAHTMTQATAAPTTCLTLAGAKVSDANPLRLGAGVRVYVAIGVALAAGVQVVAMARDY